MTVAILTIVFKNYIKFTSLCSCVTKSVLYK